MSIEQTISNLTDAINRLAAAMEKASVAAAAPVAQPEPVTAPLAAPTPAAPVAAPVVPAPTVPAAASPSNPMPAPPTFDAPAPAAPSVPFSDPKGLIDYVMSSYKALGQAKGAQIQQVLLNLGVQNINDVKPEQYTQLYAGVEALKGK